MASFFEPQRIHTVFDTVMQVQSFTS